MAAPAKRSHRSVTWKRSPLQTLNVEQLLSALLRLRSRPSLDVGLLLSVAAPDLGHGVAPLGLKLEIPREHFLQIWAL